MPLLSLQSVTKSYWRGPRELPVLRGASLELEAGTLVSIYGPRNSGKTALLEIAAGLQQPDSGRTTFGGADLATLTDRELARIHREEIGWVERAGPHSSDLIVAVYTALPLYRDLGRHEAHDRALAALAACEVADCAGERWEDLSDFARIRCAIAQTIVREPKLLIADDPTAGLGMLERNYICGLLRSIAEDDGLGVLMAVPDMPSMLQAHDVLLLGRGRLVGPAQPRDDDDAATVLDFPGGRRSA